MNLHEECLIKYLINPLELFYTTELLKNNISLTDKNIIDVKEYTNRDEISYNKL
jgi:hypothetical protein